MYFILYLYKFFKVHYVVACINTSFLYIAKQYLIVLICSTFWLSIHQVANIWVISAFLLLMNNAAMNLHVQVFIWAYVFFSSWIYIYKRKYWVIWWLCLALWGTTTLFSKGDSTILHSHQQCLRVPVSSYPYQSLVVVQLLSCVQLFVILWIAARQASLSITKSQNLLKLMSIKSVMPSNHPILFIPFSSCIRVFPSIRVFSLLLTIFLILAILVGMKWYLIVVLISHFPNGLWY